MAGFALARNQTVAIERGVDGALGRHAYSLRTRRSRILRAPKCGFFLSEVDDQVLDLLRQLIGVSYRPA